MSTTTRGNEIPPPPYQTSSSIKYIFCKNCRKYTQYFEETTYPPEAHIFALILFVIFFPIFWLPYVVMEKYTIYYCIHCERPCIIQ